MTTPEHTNDLTRVTIYRPGKAHEQIRVGRGEVFIGWDITAWGLVLLTSRVCTLHPWHTIERLEWH